MKAQYLLSHFPTRNVYGEEVLYLISKTEAVYEQTNV